MPAPNKCVHVFMFGLLINRHDQVNKDIMNVLHRSIVDLEKKKKCTLQVKGTVIIPVYNAFFF